MLVAKLLLPFNFISYFLVVFSFFSSRLSSIGFCTDVKPSCSSYRHHFFFSRWQRFHLKPNVCSNQESYFRCVSFSVCIEIQFKCVRIRTALVSYRKEHEKSRFITMSVGFSSTNRRNLTIKPKVL